MDEFEDEVDETRLDDLSVDEPDSLKLIPIDGTPDDKVFKPSRDQAAPMAGRYMYSIVATTSLGSLIWGYHFSVLAGAMLLIDDHYNLNIIWHEVIVSILVAGASVGAAIAGWLSDKFGRWKMMMCTAVLYGVGAVIMATSFSKFCLVVGRAIAGLAIGTELSA